MGIELVTFKGQTVTPKDDALLQQYTLGQDGFFYGCAVTYTGGNTLHLSSGEGVICGREFKLDDTDLSAALPASGTLLGQVYAHIDLSNEDNPIQLIVETAAELTELTKDDDLNINNGEYDLQICTFTATTSALTDVESTVVYLVKGGGGGSMADAYDSSSPYVVGENFTKDGVYYEVIAPISAGDPLVLDVNVKSTNPGTQITDLNRNLTNCLVWNSTDDYAYVNGRKTSVRCGLNSILLYHNGTFGQPYDNGVYSSHDSLGTPMSFVNTGAILKTSADMYPSGKQTTLVFTDTIDFSTYSKVKVVTNQGTVEVDLTNVNTSAYLGICAYNDGGRNFGVYVSPNQQYFGYHSSDYAYREIGLTATDVSTTFSISEITVE